MSEIDPTFEGAALAIVSEALRGARDAASQIAPDDADLAALAIIASAEKQLRVLHQECGREVHAAGRSWAVIAEAVGLKRPSSAESLYSGAFEKRVREQLARLSATNDAPAAESLGKAEALARLERMAEEYAASPMKRFEDALAAANGSRVHGGMAHCPAHEDSSPSLAVGAPNWHQVLVHCFAGCSLESVVAAVGLTVADLGGAQS